MGGLMVKRISLEVDDLGVHLMQGDICLLSADQSQSDDYIIAKLRKLMCSGDI